MTTYTHTTLGTAKALLADQLGDTGKRFHSDVELGSALIETLRIWNAITQFCRERSTFSTTANQPFYSLSSVLKNTSNALVRAQTVRDRTLLSEIEYHLMEPQSFSTWLGTDQFTLQQVLNALQTVRNRFIADTACTISEYTPIQIVGSGNGQATLSDDVIGIRRAMYRTSTGRCITLRKTSERVAMASNATWTTPGAPVAYSVSASPQLTVQLVPPPEEGGTLELLVVKTGANLNVDAGGAVGTTLGIPDDFTWAVKYGALAELYTDQRSTDTVRLERCQQMYDLGVQLCKLMPVVLYGELDGAIVLPATISSTDMRQNGWQGAGSGQPTILSIVGLDFIALTPQPDSAPHSVLLNVVTNAIVPSSPTADTEYLNIGREQLSVILGMAQYIVSLKFGGALYQTTFAGADEFFNQASKYSLRRSAASTSLQPMLSATSREFSVTPWEHSPSTASTDPDETRQERNSRRRSTFRWKQ